MSNSLFQTFKTTSLSGLVLTLLLSFSGCKPAEETTQEAEPTKHDHSKHDHGLVNVEEQWPGSLVPSIQIEALPDSMSGWNINIITKNFNFTPERVNQDATPNEGHAHLFVDNYKFARLYGNWFHLKALTPGKHEVRVTLNANDHSLLGSQGNEIASSINIEQK